MSLRRGALFIISTLVPRRFPGADNPNQIPSRCKAYHQQTLRHRMSDDDLAIFRTRMIRIVEDPGERIGEYGRGFLEFDTLLRQIRSSLCGMPLEDEAQSGARYHVPDRECEGRTLTSARTSLVSFAAGGTRLS